MEKSLLYAHLIGGPADKREMYVRRGQRIIVIETVSKVGKAIHSIYARVGTCRDSESAEFFFVDPNHGHHAA
jgi:hypothetical protein